MFIMERKKYKVITTKLAPFKEGEIVELPLSRNTIHMLKETMIEEMKAPKKKDTKKNNTK